MIETTATQQIIPASDLIIMDDLATHPPFTIELAYAHDRPPNIFGTIYHPHAKLILHKDLAKIVQLCAQKIHAQHGLYLRLYDGLRTTDAQAKMSVSDIVKQNPHWLEEPNRLLSPPGSGAHPRGMAIDLTLQTPNGTLLDMGTVFDHLAENAEAEHNPAHREHPYISEKAKKNRALLSESMLSAAKELNTPLLPLPQEWWDFRLPAEIYNQYAPLSDSDLPPEMRMVNTRQ